ncbi:hypothetical protein HPB51_017427 [Rhipicephalus microplus]|uniref:Uncharacterized protein n=1 Tax=Rhipicephalus microplus TaxID=6941 RepID=A0A9J6D5X1_RHIMP|nr:hypothetical protein HPB51_017427 [Rhipicephalus microplus]
MYALLTTLEAGQATILAELKAINTRLTSTEQTLADLVARIAQTEDQCKLLPDMRSDVEVLLRSSTQTSDSIAGIEERLNDAEDRLRRCNLVFYGISEGESESWSDSEKLVTDICNKNWKIALEPKDIHRAHRIGEIARDKKRPIIVNFSSFRTKDDILSKAFKLKGTTVSISVDFCAATRSIHRELLRFAREQKVSFKLRYKKLITDKKTYYYDTADKAVKERTARAS